MRCISSLIFYYSDMNTLYVTFDIFPRASSAIQRCIVSPWNISWTHRENRRLWMRITSRDERRSETHHSFIHDFRQRIRWVGCRVKVVVAGEIYWTIHDPRTRDYLPEAANLSVSSWHRGRIPIAPRNSRLLRENLLFRLRCTYQRLRDNCRRIISQTPLLLHDISRVG